MCHRSLSTENYLHVISFRPTIPDLLENNKNQAAYLSYE